MKIYKIEVSPFKSSKNFVNKIRGKEKYTNNEIFKEYFGYQNPSFIAKDLLKANQVKNNQKEIKALYSVNKLRNPVFRKEIHENENLDKVIDIVEIIPKFDKKM